MAELDVKRIINFTEQSTLSPGDYVAVDSSGNGTKKYNLGALLQPATTSAPGLMSSQDKAALNQAGSDITDLKSGFSKSIKLSVFNSIDLDGTTGFIQNNQDAGSVCPLSPITYSNFGYLVLRNIPKNIVFTVTGTTTGAGRARLWAWLNPDGTLISKADISNASITVDLTSPVDNSILVLNFQTQNFYNVTLKDYLSPLQIDNLFNELSYSIEIGNTSDYIPVLCEFEQGRYQNGVKNGVAYDTACRTVNKIKTSDCDYVLINRTNKKYIIYAVYFDANGDYVTQTSGQQIHRYAVNKTYDSFVLTVVDYTNNVFTNKIVPTDCYTNIVLCKANTERITEAEERTSIIGNYGYSLLNVDFENGRIDANGANNDAPYTTRTRSIEYLETANVDYVINSRNKDYLVYFFYYDANKTFVIQSPATGQSANVNAIDKTYPYFRLVVLNYNNSSYDNEITPSETKANINIAKITALSQLLGNVNAEYGGLVPTYFNANLASVKNAVVSHKGMYGRNGTTFLFVTDLHWGQNQKHSPSLIHYLNLNSLITNIVLGGDYIDQYANKQTAIDTMNWCLSRFFKLTNNVFPMYGNHDSNSNGTTSESYMTDAETFSIINQWMNNETAYGNNYFDFYWDEEKTNTRYIILDTGAQSIDGGVIAEATFEWLNDVLVTNKNIVIFAHWLFTPTTWNHPLVDGELVGSYTASATRLFSALDAINANGGKVQAIITGHLHCDYNDVTSGGIPVVWTDTDSMIALGEYTATAGTITEQCFDVYSIDYDAKKIYCDRVGRGISRVISY